MFGYCLTTTAGLLTILFTLKEKKRNCIERIIFTDFSIIDSEPGRRAVSKYLTL
jgi:hypothetical protein